MNRVAVSPSTATSPDIFTFPRNDDDDALIDEALRIAKLTLQDTAAMMERVSPGGHGAERLRIMAEAMGALLDVRT